MNLILIVAVVICALVGVIHSLLGEVLIFRLMREGKLIPTNGRPVLKERHVRILWATWHLPSILIFGPAMALWTYAYLPVLDPNQIVIKNSIALSIAVSAFLVLYATKGRHPGWIGLSIAAILTALG